MSLAPRTGTAPTWLAILAGVGAVGGMYNLIRSALAAARTAARGAGGQEPGQ